VNLPLLILHLEDDPTDVRLVADALREAQVRAQITAVEDRPSLVAALENGQFDLILADYKLPGFDGLEALKLWRARWPFRPFLFVTGSMGEDLAVESLRCGATDYILKGNLARLVPAIHRAVEEVETHERRQLAEAALRKSEEQFRSMADHSPFLIWLCGTDKRCAWVNRGWSEFVGRTLEQELGSRWAHHIHPDDCEETWQTYDRAFDARQPFTVEYRLRRHDGAWRWVLDNGAPIYDGDQRFAGYIGSCVDLTEQKLAEEALKTSLGEKEVLLREVHHRVKNNLQVISSLVSLQADGSTSPDQREILQEVCDRVRTIALVHEKLYQSETLAQVNFADYTQSLLQHIWSVHGHAADPIHLELDLQPVPLPMDQAVPCGLLLNELASNALKHAFHGRPHGTIAVSLRRGENRRVYLTVRDDGVGLPPEMDWRRSPSLGLQLVQMLSTQLNGTVDVSRRTGTEFRLAFTAGPTCDEPHDCGL
jgi:PAS domain S-box-containing protein